jgi:hypothetical protein
MQPDPAPLLDSAGIDTPVIGFYDLADPTPFEPFARPGRCIFSAWERWRAGESVLISSGSCSCMGGGYWIGGTMPAWAVKAAGGEQPPLAAFASRLNQREGFKDSDEIMLREFEHREPYIIRNGQVVIGPLRADQYQHLMTVTFYLNPDQLSLLVIAAEYHNAAPTSAITVPFGSGCGQLAAVLGDLDSEVPRAAIGATDVAMREHLPPDLLAFTVNKPMFEQLCALDRRSVLHKPFWTRLQRARRGLPGS